MPAERQRTIRTDFYQPQKKLVRSNYAKWAGSAVALAVLHMQSARYAANLCEVYDTASGALHAVITYPRGSRKIEIIYRRDPKIGSPE